MDKLHIAIRSYKRAGKITSLDLFKDAYIWVPESQYKDYAKYYDESKIIYSSKNGKPILLLFRELLEKVPIWNSEIIDSECSRIINNSNCDWIDDLITAVFISHTKILTSIGPNQSFQKINVQYLKQVHLFINHI